MRPRPWTNGAIVACRVGYGSCDLHGLLRGARAKTMNIRFTSSLTPEDENLIAPALIRAFTSFLDLLPIAYVVRIDTSDSRVYQHSGPEGYPETVGEPARPRLGARSSTGRGHS